MLNRKPRRRFPRFCIFPGYNWCGPGCSGPGAPINKVDAACKAHDECYRRTGAYCKCDREFIRRLQSCRNPHTREGRQANVIYNYMKAQSFFTCGF
ncbi:phospholipase [Virgibacillus phasianinus]|uniref:Phospholipase n=1 Tax=Virgibacillus phasianinus TaxID=2017483 RepID=A0A220U1N1_9BACI|nr:phospholipase [Virgibacillus phasianinus]ASK61922.1 phospholipase [Virgibacillus phasianinus]